jgi:pimeloyl-ACP methyl ester carboxylesterase
MVAPGGWWPGVAHHGSDVVVRMDATGARRGETSVHSRMLRQVGGDVHLLDSATSGPPLVLVHDLDGCAAGWLDVAPGLAAHHRVLAPDLPGCGRSPVGRRRTSMTAHADLVAEVVRRETDGPVTLVGNSAGALVALLLAVRHSWAARAVVLLAPALPRRTRGALDVTFLPLLTATSVPGLLLLEPWRRSLQTPQERVGALLAASSAPGSDGASAGTLAAMVEVAAGRSRSQQLRGWPGAARSLFWWLARPTRFHETADRVTAPVTLVEGVEDPVLPRSVVRAALGRHPDWSHVPLAGVGHIPQLERPAAVVDTVRAVAAG